ncbi:MAG TPA: response regulator [Deltaproteobacteria bacterium]|nr:response regulator [Deltaproteobacteria bacterium]
MKSLSPEEKVVLIIDDDEGDCYLMEDILAEMGVTVVTALGGVMGIRLLSEREYPVVITDLRMPDVDGMAVIDFIRKKALNSLVVVVTGFASIDNVIEAQRLGAYDYIIKPFGSDLLRFTVKRAFDFIALRREKERLKVYEVGSQIASTTSHEVFQPLTVLMGEANAILRSTQDEEVRQSANEILAQSREIRDIIRKMEQITDYATKTYPGGHTIIDIEKGSQKTGNHET